MRKSFLTFVLVPFMVAGNIVPALALEDNNAKNTKQSLKKLQKEKEKLVSEKNEVNLKIEENQSRINEVRKDLEKVLSDKLQNETDLNKLSSKLDEEIENLKKQVFNYYINSYSSDTTILKELVNSKNTTDFIILNSHLKYIVDDRDKKIDEVSTVLEKQKELSEKLAKNEAELLYLQTKLTEEQEKLENASQEKETKISELKKEESKLKDILIIQEEEENAIKQKILAAEKINASKNETSEKNNPEKPSKPSETLENKTPAVTKEDRPDQRSQESHLKKTTIENEQLLANSNELQRPVDSYVLTSKFGMRTHPITGQRKMHFGVDLAAPSGTPIMSSQKGKVIISQYSPSYGNYIVIDHGDGLSTLYAHLSKRLVHVGDKVSAKQVIGNMGSTGMSTGSHLHYEIRVRGEKINPLEKIPTL